MDGSADTVDVRLAGKQFTEACRALCERTPVWHEQTRTARWAAPLYVAVRQALTARSARSGASAARSRLPLRIDALEWVRDVDSTIGGVWREPGGSMYALKAMAGRVFAPQHVPQLIERTRVLGGWAVAAARVLGSAPIEVAVRRPCPLCGSLFTWVGRERVRVFALVASEQGAWCRSVECGASWSVEQLPLLARLLEESGSH